MEKRIDELTTDELDLICGKWMGGGFGMATPHNHKTPKRCWVFEGGGHIYCVDGAHPPEYSTSWRYAGSLLEAMKRVTSDELERDIEKLPDGAWDYDTADIGVYWSYTREIWLCGGFGGVCGKGDSGPLAIARCCADMVDRGIRRKPEVAR